MTEDTKHFRGFDPNRDLPADPLGDIHPMVEELMRLSKEHGVMVLLPTRSYSDSWARDLWEREGVILTESPPCAFSAAEAVILFGGEEHQVTDLRIVIEKSRWSDRTDYVPESLELTGTIELKTYVQAGQQGRLTLAELNHLVERDPEPAGRRYGPYDADPHTKGRRRRFRTQRKA